MAFPQNQTFNFPLFAPFLFKLAFSRILRKHGKQYLCTNWWYNLCSRKAWMWFRFRIQLIQCRNFCKRSILIGGQEQFVTKWLNLWPNEHQFHFSEGIFEFIWLNGDTFVKAVFVSEVMKIVIFMRARNRFLTTWLYL